MATSAIRLSLVCKGHLLNVRLLTNNFTHITSAAYAKKIIPGQTKGVPLPTTAKKRLEPETDPNKLTKFLCGGNIMKEGVDPELGPDEAYPEWLWTLKTDPKPVPLEEMDPDSWAYWRRLRKLNRKRIGLMNSTRNRFNIY